MSAKRARKVLNPIDPNIQKSSRSYKRQKTNLPDPIYSDPSIFVPMSYIEHSSEPKLPDHIGIGPGQSLDPLSIFDQFWDNIILSKLVDATNAYAKEKGATRQQWRHNTTIAESRVFLGITIIMGVVRVPNIRRYWTFGLLGKKGHGVSLEGGKSIGIRRYCEIRRFLHISMPQDTANLSRKDWWKKMEPLSSHLRQRSKDLFQPSTHVSVDEMMIPFTGRSRHTVKIPSKPIPVGYKIFALCDRGYTLDWMFTSRTESVAELIRDPDVSPTSSAVLQLCQALCPIGSSDTVDLESHANYIVYMDNGFSTIPLFRKLRELSIGACGTARINSAEYPIHLKNDTSLTEWNTMDGVVVGEGSKSVLCCRWIDNNIVRMLSTVHPWAERTLRERRKPRTTSTNACTVRKAFGDQERRLATY